MYKAFKGDTWSSTKANSVVIPASSVTSTSNPYQFRPYFSPVQASIYPTNTTVTIEVVTTSSNPVNVTNVTLYLSDGDGSYSQPSAYNNLKYSVSSYLGSTETHTTIVIHIADDAPKIVIPEYLLLPTTTNTAIQFAVNSYTAVYDPSETAYQQAVLEQTKAVEDAINNGTDVISNGLDSVENSVNEQGEAIQGKLDNVQQSIDDAPDREYDYITGKNDATSGDQDDAQGVLDDLLPLDSAKTALKSLYDAVSSNTVKSTLTFPAGKLPASLGGQTLWSQQTVDFRDFSRDSNMGVIFVAIRVVFSAGFVYGAVIYVINTVHAGLGLGAINSKGGDSDV